jgi:hypothetical protein
MVARKPGMSWETGMEYLKDSVLDLLVNHEGNRRSGAGDIFHAMDENLPEVQGLFQVCRMTSQGRLCQLQAMSVEEWAPTLDRTNSPVDKGIVPLEP